MKSILVTVLLSALAAAPVALAEATAPTAKSAAALGDLSSYVAIAKDTLKIAEGGDLKAAKTRVKDLETAWDEAEADMRPKSPDDWETADHALDRAFAKLRSSKPDKTACVDALKSVISTLESLQKHG